MYYYLGDQMHFLQEYRPHSICSWDLPAPLRLSVRRRHCPLDTSTRSTSEMYMYVYSLYIIIVQLLTSCSDWCFMV